MSNDVQLWLVSRAFHGKPPVREMRYFVVVNSTLHDEFDKFKASTIRKSYSFIEFNELLRFYSLSESNLLSSPAKKFEKMYLEIQGSQVDELVEWVLEMRKKYSDQGESVFATGAQSLLAQDETGDHNKNIMYSQLWIH